MTEFQICPCGQQPGYPHAADCPYPYFGNHEALIQKWHEDRAYLRAALQTEPGRLYAIKHKNGSWYQAGRVWQNSTSGVFIAHAHDVIQIEEIDP